MARGSAVREFVGKLRTAFYLQLTAGESEYPQPDQAYEGTSVGLSFERAVNDTLLGNGSEQKPVAKPRKKRGPNKPKPQPVDINAREQAQP